MRGRGAAAGVPDMDIITQTDFLITNKDEKTTFQFRMPSEGGVELEFYFRAMPRAFRTFFITLQQQTSEAN